MAAYLITAPTADVVTLAEAKAQLRITGTSQDTMIEAMIDAVVAALDPATQGWLDRALRSQVWELRLPHFPCGNIKLPYPPLISVDSVKYDDTGGVERTLTLTSGYRVFGIGQFNKAYIAPPYLQYWPTARCDKESVRIRFTCGYPASPDTLPAPIKQAVLLGVRALYSLGERSMFESQSSVDGVGEKRWVVSDAGAKVLQDATDRLLAPFRVY